MMPERQILDDDKCTVRSRRAGCVDRPRVVVTALCNQPEAIASDLSDDYHVTCFVICSQIRFHYFVICGRVSLIMTTGVRLFRISSSVPLFAAVDYGGGWVAGVIRSCGNRLSSQCRTLTKQDIRQLSLKNGTGTVCYCTEDGCNNDDYSPRRQTTYTTYSTKQYTGIKPQCNNKQCNGRYGSNTASFTVSTFFLHSLLALLVVASYFSG